MKYLISLPPMVKEAMERDGKGVFSFEGGNWSFFTNTNQEPGLGATPEDAMSDLETKLAKLKGETP